MIVFAQNTPARAMNEEVFSRILMYNKETSLQTSFLAEWIIRETKQKINTHLCHWIEPLLQDLEDIVQLYGKFALQSEVLLSVYEPDWQPLILNPAFVETTGYTEDDFRDSIKKGIPIQNMLYRGENLEKVNKYVNALSGGKYSGYRNIVFPLHDKTGVKHDILWSNFNLPDRTNVRIWSEVPEEYRSFFRGELILKWDIDYPNIFLISRQVDSITDAIRAKIGTNRQIWPKPEDAPIMQEKVESVIQQARLMGIAIDFMMQEGSSPITIYQKNKPIFLNKAFLTLVGYSQAEIDAYYTKHGEVSTLFYKGADLGDVQNKLSSIQDKERGGYKGVEFTFTRNPAVDFLPWERITLSWTTYIWKDKTVRSARFIRIEK